jgi:hypothetical protein
MIVSELAPEEATGRGLRVFSGVRGWYLPNAGLVFIERGAGI